LTAFLALLVFAELFRLSLLVLLRVLPSSTPSVLAELLRVSPS